jgi:hypothetical protein
MVYKFHLYYEIKSNSDVQFLKSLLQNKKRTNKFDIKVIFVNKPNPFHIHKRIITNAMGKRLVLI